MTAPDRHAACRAAAARVEAAAAPLAAAPPGVGGELVPLGLLAGLLLCARAAGGAEGPAFALWVLAGGWFLTALGVIAHDCVHHSLSTRTWFNDGIGTLVLGLDYASFSAYRALHLAHHRHTGFDEDPSGDAPRVQKSTNLVTHLLLILVPFGFPLFQIVPGWAAAFGTDPTTYPARVRRGIRRDALFVVALHLGLHALLGPAGYRAYVWIFFASMVMIIQLFGFNHVGTEFYTDCTLCNTRNIHASPPALEWLTLFAGYHVEHHLVPPVPWYRLPAVHRLLEGEGGANYSLSGYLAAQAFMIRGYWRRLLGQPGEGLVPRPGSPGAAG